MKLTITVISGIFPAMVLFRKKVIDCGPFLRFVSISWLLLHTYMVVIETLSAGSEVRKEHGKSRIKDEKERQGQIK